MHPSREYLFVCYGRTMTLNQRSTEELLANHSTKDWEAGDKIYRYW